jgi:hypothetical protein
VANYVDRPEAIRALRDAVLAENRGQPIALTALAGMGGIGKTVLAQALVRDEIVQQAFPDGIVWITIGRESTRDSIAVLKDVAKALGDDPGLYEGEPASLARFASLLEKKLP